ASARSAARARERRAAAALGQRQRRNEDRDGHEGARQRRGFRAGRTAAGPDRMNAVQALIEAERLPADYFAVVEQHWQPLADRIASEEKRPLLVGINGAQGAGKSTLCKFLEQLLAERGLHAVTLSIDDLYL